MASGNAACEFDGTVADMSGQLAAALAGAGGGGSKSTVVTLSGDNSGATMEAGAGAVEDLVVVEACGGDDDDGSGEEEEEEVQVTAYTNSNYQAVNNSVLVAGSCAVKDPGVHVVVVEHVEDVRDFFFDDGGDAARMK